ARRAAPQCFTETRAQRFALAAPFGVADQRDRHLRDDRGGVVARTVVDHDHVMAMHQHAFQEAADRQCLVEAGHDHEGTGGGVVQNVISMSSDNPGDSGKRRRRPFSTASACSKASACALAGLSPATPCSAKPPPANGSSAAPSNARSSRAPADPCGASTSAAPKASVVWVISPSGPVEATSLEANSTGVSSAHANTAVSSKPAAKLR